MVAFARAHAGIAEEREWDQRRARASLDHDERGEQEGRGDEDADRLRRAPADGRGPDQRVDERRKPGRHGHGAGEVKAPARELTPALGDQHRGQERRGDPDGNVYEQHRAPAQRAGQHATEEDAGGGARAGDRTPDRERPVALGPLTEGGGDERERRRSHERRAEPLDRAGGDQPRGALREAAGERGEREHPEADREHASAAEEVGDPPAEEQEAAEGQNVGVDHPGEVGQGEVKAAPDRGQRDVDDRRVEHDDELGHRQQRQRPPAAINTTGLLGEGSYE